MKSLLNKALLVFTFILLLAGCAQQVRTSITTYVNDGVALSPASATVVPAAGMSGDDAEFRYFASVLSERLREAGFAEGGESAQYKFALSYGVSRQEAESRRGPAVQTGFGIYGGRMGSTFVISDDDDIFEYLHEIKLDVSQNKGNAFESVATIKAASEGRCAHLVGVYDEMLEAVFKKLQRKNGSVVTLKVPVKKPCSVKE